jgi:hypothetical protein
MALGRGVDGRVCRVVTADADRHAGHRRISQPFKDAGGKRVVALLGATLQADVPAARIGPSSRALGVVLQGREIARVPVDFGRLD